MDFFVVDTVGDTANSGHFNIPKLPKLPKPYVSVFDGTVPATAVEEVKKEELSDGNDDDDDDDDFGGLPPPGESIAKILSTPVDDMSSIVDYKKHALNVRTFRADKRASKSTGRSTHQGITQKNELNQTDVNAEMKNAVLTASIEKKDSIARLGMSEAARQKLNRAERQKTKGREWFNMAAPEVTPEMKNELDLIRMRSVLDPKKVYGRVEKRSTPKYFEIGTVLESPLDHFNERGTKKANKQSLVDELMADAEFQKFNKRKYAEALEKRKKKAYHKAVLKMKKDKKKRK
ncbi:deoxynucleotidyltransferase terminal-interacting protein 2 [Anopheles ziemanni]|uniref:deoxynucleotidyltransferase terminal-interacting protein 2 n=1 Tax=Anopheles coustani TaxID=139045 RepID=UPI0026588743|nr:deoxynucleotidyltransferase terminal-interacting protein 2 [Anopheles coustani]XP_058171944.1 deoxynucleotidyltransferase terminal-interacting protein 2 [Anopheles ziemanni]